MSEIILRPYQQAAVNAVISNIHENTNDIVSIAAGGGKSLVISEVARRISGNILILQPNKEILQQNYAKLARYVPQKQLGIYSASLNSRSIKKYTFATIGSIYKKPDLFQDVDLVLLDESHLCDVAKSKTMYMKFFKDIGYPKVIGLTATPYRNVQTYKDVGGGKFSSTLSVQLINRMHPPFWDKMLFVTNIKYLIDNGYLSPLKYEDHSFLPQEKLKLNTSRSDFDLDAFEKVESSFRGNVLDTIRQCEKRFRSVLVFCSTVNQAFTLSGLIKGSEAISGETKAISRDRITKGFLDGSIKTVFNVGVLTTGYDNPALDCIIMLRPTKSLSLWVQMVGRGTRIAEGKTHCTVIDFTDTVNKLGRVETLELKQINNQWEVVTEKDSFHGKIISSITMKKPKRKRGKVAGNLLKGV